MVEMRQSNKCGGVMTDEIFNLPLGFRPALESASPALCMAPAKFNDSTHQNT